MPFQRALALLIYICVTSLFALSAKEHVVVIDPGHGGRDYGAVGAITNEKTINLDVALELQRLLKEQKGLKTVMTRADDRFIELAERANIANKAHGDLFVSIHVNSVAKSNKNRTKVRGASVYALGLHRSASNFEVAKRENSVMELEADYSTRYQGFDPNSTESYIIFELSQNKHLDQSINFAEMAQTQLCTTAGRADRGVLQAGFWVLHASAMPAVLVELDFICNPESERYLNSKAGKKQMARALANAITKYFDLKELPSLPEPESEVCPEESAPAEAQPGAVTYRVQFIAADRQLKEADFKGLKKVEAYEHGGLYKYTAGGDFPSEEAAERHAARVRKKFPQAFVIKWQNGTRLM